MALRWDPLACSRSGDGGWVYGNALGGRLSAEGWLVSQQDEAVLNRATAQGRKEIEVLAS